MKKGTEAYIFMCVFLLLLALSTFNRHYVALVDDGTVAAVESTWWGLKLEDHALKLVDGAWYLQESNGKWFDYFSGEDGR